MIYCPVIMCNAGRVYNHVSELIACFEDFMTLTMYFWKCGIKAKKKKKKKDEVICFSCI